jgi:hypothetical protein
MAYAIASWEEEERDCLRAVGMGTWRKAWLLLCFPGASHSYCSWVILPLPLACNIVPVKETNYTLVSP